MRSSSTSELEDYDVGGIPSEPRPSIDPSAGRSLLVVAHPDDEILWFASVLGQVTTTVVCFLDYGPQPGLGQGRRRALEALPLDGLRCLGLSEADSLDRADWCRPRLEPAGLRLPPGHVRERYRANAARLARHLPALVEGYDVIFGHNPWGEYGHEDHVQLHAILGRVCRRMGLDLWVPTCCGPKALPLARRYRLRPRARRLRRPVDRALTRRIRRIYEQQGCWTWHDDWQWPAEESFVRSADLERLPLSATHEPEVPGYVAPMAC